LWVLARAGRVRAHRVQGAVQPTKRNEGKTPALTCVLIVPYQTMISVGWRFSTAGKPV